MSVTAKPSATVVLLREAPDAPEILFVKRRSGDAFGDAWTFPGGVLDADESAAAPFCTGLSSDEADAVLGVDAGGLGYYSAAVRELYEETGILPAGMPEADEQTRIPLISGALSWGRFLERHGLTIPCEQLHYFAHWITPTALPKRWSTRFFLATAQAGAEARPDGSEVTDCCWMTAAAAIAAEQSGDGKLPFPTVRNLELLAGHDSVKSLVAWARCRQAGGIAAIQPEIVSEDGKRRIMLPEIAD